MSAELLSAKVVFFKPPNFHIFLPQVVKQRFVIKDSKTKENLGNMAKITLSLENKANSVGTLVEGDNVVAELETGTYSVKSFIQ